MDSSKPALFAKHTTQSFDIRFVYSLLTAYQPPFFKSHRWMRRKPGGWSISPWFMAQSGAPLQVKVSTGGS